MVKILLFLSLMIGSLSASSLIATVGAKSNHLIDGEFNENHNWYGIGYRPIEKDKYAIQIDYANFINSYNDDTEFLAVTGIYTPVKYGDIKLGVTGSLGYQRGYYTNSEGTVHPSNAKRLGLTNESILVLYSFYAELDNIVINYTYIPNSVEAMTIGFKAAEW